MICREHPLRTGSRNHVAGMVFNGTKQMAAKMQGCSEHHTSCRRGVDVDDAMKASRGQNRVRLAADHAWQKLPLAPREETPAPRYRDDMSNIQALHLRGLLRKTGRTETRLIMRHQRLWALTSSGLVTDVFVPDDPAPRTCLLLRDRKNEVQRSDTAIGVLHINPDRMLARWHFGVRNVDS